MADVLTLGDLSAVPPEGVSDAYRLGWEHGRADRDPDPAMLAYGADRLNDYERGYIDSGRCPCWADADD